MGKGEGFILTFSISISSCVTVFIAKLLLFDVLRYGKHIRNWVVRISAEFRIRVCVLESNVTTKLYFCEVTVNWISLGCDQSEKWMKHVGGKGK